MSSSFYHESREDARAPAQPAIAIHDGKAGTPPPVVPGHDEACLRLYCNTAYNSRIGFRSAMENLRPRWKVELAPRFAPRFVLAAGERVLLVGLDTWLLTDAAGQALQRAERGDGEVVADPPNALFYSADLNGRIAAHSLRDGAKAFAVSVYFGDSFGRTFIRRSGQQLLVVSIERPTDMHGGRPPRLSVVELQHLGEPFVLSDTLRLKSAERLDYLFRDTVRLLSAAHDGALVLATDDRVYLADEDLRLRTELTGEFVPLTMSLDETGRAYLLVQTSTGRALWVVTADGKRLVNTPVPATMATPLAPPVVGYDHRVYLIDDTRIRAINSDGAFAWEFLSAARIVGAVVTADNKLLVSSGSQVASFDGIGKRTVVHEFADERLRTPPVLTANGELLVASERFLYCLAAQPTAERR